MTLETIINRNLPCLLPFFIESELSAIQETSTNRVTNHILSLLHQIDEHEAELASMIEAMTAKQLDSLRTVVEYLWEKSYSEDVFNKSTVIKLMREQLNFRQRDRQLGRDEGRDEGRAEDRADVRNMMEQIQQEGQLTITREQMEAFFKRLAEKDKEKSQKLL